MKIYGAGTLEEIKKCTQLGVVGILTNPQGYEQYFQGKMTLEEITKAILEVTDLPIFMQIHGKSTEEIIERARNLNAISPQVGFKIISDEKGFKAMRQLQQEGINCLATAMFTISQAAIAASVGAFGICPFIARARDGDIDPFKMLKAIKKGYNKLERAPEIIAVSLRNVEDIDLALSAGVDAVGMRYPLIKKMMEHPLSKNAEELFAKNWATVKGEDISYLAHALKLGGEGE